MNTITKLEYILQVLKDRKALYINNWYIKLLAIPTLKDERVDGLTTWDLCIKEDGLYTTGVDMELMKIVDYKVGQPLFHLEDPITVDGSHFDNLKEPTPTTVGTALVNAVLFPKEIEYKFEYINHKVSKASAIEDTMGPMTVNENPEGKYGDNEITVTQMLEIADNLGFLDSLGTIINVAASEKTITPSPGSKELIAKLISEAGDEIKNPLKIVEIEQKLLEHDRKWLADDPVYQNAFTGKSELGRFKTHVMQGNTLDFIKDPSNDTLITRAISDGMNPSPTELPKYFNDLRFGSYSRGDKTALGGYVYKILQRSLTSLRIIPDACNTRVGLHTRFNKAESNFFVGRYYKDGNTWKLIRNRETAMGLIDKPVEIRSPMFCKTGGNFVCYACLSVRYRHLPNGVTNIASGISSEMLTMFLKQMHGTKTTTNKILREHLIN